MVRRVLATLRERMTTMPGHRIAEHATGWCGVGITGPGKFDGSIAVHPTANRGAFIADGEVYHVTGPDACPRCGAEAWQEVARRWTRSPAITTLDGLYTAVAIEGDGGVNPELSIFNDRYGSRRLYYAELPDAFVFAAELAPIAAWLGPAAEIDDAFVRESICLGSPLGDHTWIRGVSLFPPATVMRVSPGKVRTTRYWTGVDIVQPGTNVAEDRFERLHSLWSRAVETRVRGPRVGQLLSGGLDSRLILGEATRHRHQWMTATFGEPGADDVRFARRCAEAAGVPWLFWRSPRPGWLERRLAFSVAHDGVVDVVNANHSELVDALGGLMDYEVSGFLGDVVMGGTYLGITREDALDYVPYWHSPVSVDAAAIGERARAAIDRSASPWMWMLENKLRRSINGWPHVAVNHLEVRKPFLDYALFEFCAGLAAEERRERRPQIELLTRYYPSLARLPWQKTGVRPAAGWASRTAMKGVRVTYRTGQRILAKAGGTPSPWIRNAWNVDGWCSSPAVKQAVTESVTAPSSLLADFLDRGAIATALELGFERHAIATEVVMNLYRAEHVLAKFKSLRTEAIPFPSLLSPSLA
jgi:hypothetical protein